MAWLPRLAHPGVVYHVTSRGQEQQLVPGLLATSMPRSLECRQAPIFVHILKASDMPRLPSYASSGVVAGALAFR
jgi:hypothetical protein